MTSDGTHAAGHLAPGANRPGRAARPGRRIAAALLVVGALGAVGLWAVTSARPGALGDDGPTTTVPHVAGDCHRGPNEYRPELEVVVDAAPLEDLVDGTPIAVRTDCLAAGAGVVVATCAATDAPIYDRCDRGAGSSFRVPTSGLLDVIVEARRVITTEAGEAVDCAADGACVLSIASFEDEWGQQPLHFRSGLGPVEVAPRGGDVYRFLDGTITPDAPVEVGAEVTLGVEGFEPDEDLVVGLCADDALDGGLYRWCAPLTQGFFDSAETATAPPLVADGEGGAEWTGEAPSSFVPTVAGWTDDADADEPVDCTEREGRCLLVVAAAVDLQRLAVFPLTVTP